MRRRQFLSLGISLLAVSGVLAHPGHGPHTHEIEVDAEEAALLAKDEVVRKVKSGALEASWAAIAANRPEPIQSGKTIEWKVSFDNPAAPQGRQRLYVFLLLNGTVTGINFTGR